MRELVDEAWFVDCDLEQALSHVVQRQVQCSVLAVCVSQTPAALLARHAPCRPLGLRLESRGSSWQVADASCVQVANGAPRAEAEKRVNANDRPNAELVQSTRHRASLVLPRLPIHAAKEE